MDPLANPVQESELRTILNEAHLRSVIRTLPSVGECKSGLCVDREPVGAIRFEGKARLSVLRLYTKTGRRLKLVGQVQVLANGPERESWSVEYYAHDPNFVVPQEISDKKAWWSAVLERHLQASGLSN